MEVHQGTSLFNAYSISKVCEQFEHAIIRTLENASGHKMKGQIKCWRDEGTRQIVAVFGFILPLQ
eukprot:973970-Amphidinium_carterae.2